jgi:citrate lyase subunit beta/citryl-CoA lyase
MSVNRFAVSSPVLCARPEALMAANLPDGSRVIVDIGSGGAREKAWCAARDFLDRPGTLSSAMLRIGRPNDDAELEAVSRLAALRPSGFVLSACRNAADIQMLDVMLRVAEAEHGIDAGSIAIVAEVGGEPEFFLSPNFLRGKSQRLQGLLFNTQALTEATTSEAFNEAAGRLGAPLLFARATAVLKAREAGLPCHALVGDDALAGDALRAWQETARADGFASIVVRTAAQVTELSD